MKLETRCRIHSRATKIGQRMWNRNELCSKGVPCRSRIRKRIRPWSDSSISSLRRAKLTRAPFDTRRLKDGVYDLVVTVKDIRGNQSSQSRRFTVHNRAGWVGS